MRGRSRAIRSPGQQSSRGTRVTIALIERIAFLLRARLLPGVPVRSMSSPMWEGDERTASRLRAPQQQSKRWLGGAADSVEAATSPAYHGHEADGHGNHQSYRLPEARDWIAEADRIDARERK